MSKRSIPSYPAIEMALSAFSFATMAAIAHQLRGELPWILIAFARIFMTGVIALIIARMMGIRLVVFGSRMIWIRSIVGTVGLICGFYAVTHMPITDAVAIQHTSPLWVGVVLAIIHRRAPSPAVGFAVVLGLGGVLLMERPTFDATAFTMGVALIGAVFTAFAQVSLSYLGGYSSTVVVAHYCGFASVVTLALSFLPGLNADMPSGFESVHLWLLALGVCGTFGQIFITRAMTRGDTQLMSLIGLANIAFAALYDAMLWGVVPDVPKVLGLVCIAASVIVCSRAGGRRPTAAQ